jgi:hypothetical protein
MQFALERQKLLSDEKWARRNVEDRQLMLEQIEKRQRNDTQNLKKLIEN